MLRSSSFILAIASIAVVTGSADETSGPGGITPVTLPTAPCEQSLAQQLAVPGLDGSLTKLYPVSTAVMPTLGFATTDMSIAIDPKVGDFLNQNGMAGGAVAITFNNQLIFAKAYGYADADNAVFAQPDSRFRIASVSKATTAMGFSNWRTTGSSPIR